MSLYGEDEDDRDREMMAGGSYGRPSEADADLIDLGSPQTPTTHLPCQSLPLA
jgi:hypothetical protein